METGNFILFLLLLWTLFRVAVFIDVYIQINSRGNEVPAGAKGKRGIKPFEISIFELAICFFAQDPNFIFQYFFYTPFCIFSLRYLVPWLRKSVTDEMIVHACLNTSLVIFLNQITGPTYCLEMNDIGWHSMPEKGFRNSFRLCIDIKDQKVLSFTFNGTNIHDRQQILAMLLMNLADCVHPMVHSYQNALYESMKSVPALYWRMTAHGQYLNEQAHTRAPGSFTGFNGGVDWFEQLLETHSKRPIPFHGDIDKRLMDASPFLRFARKARPLVFKELERAGLGMVDAEAYFLCSVIHSIDHYQAGKAVEWVDFRDDLASAQRFNYMSRNFFQHTQYWLLPDNYLRSHQHETDFYGRLYSGLRKIDPKYADLISLSITY
jgi:hypothetical protein